MSKHIELATPCPNCQSRLTLSIRRTPLIGFHAVRLASKPDRQEHDRSSENDSINDDSWPYTGPSPSFDSSSSFGGGTSTGSGATGSW